MMGRERLALYPGSFDPFTFGHLDIVERALRLFDAVDIVVTVNSEKSALLSSEVRCDLIRQCTVGMEAVSVTVFQGLVVDYARRRGATALVRGLRQVRDFDTEMQMAFANRRMHEELETIFLGTLPEHSMISSSLVREILRWGGDVKPFVPLQVAVALTCRQENTT